MRETIRALNKFSFRLTNDFKLNFTDDFIVEPDIDQNIVGALSESIFYSYYL